MPIYMYMQSKESQCISEAEAREIKQNTRQQRLSSLRLSTCCYKITTSKLGLVLTLKRETPPKNLLLKILQPKHISTIATWQEIENEQKLYKNTPLTQ